MQTKQVQFWSSDFGREYTDRNTPESLQVWNEGYKTRYGVSRNEMFIEFVDTLDRDIRILEVGCNTGLQLACLQKMGFENLYGIELQDYAVQRAKEITTGINIIQGNGFDLPFKDAYFDLVMTNGVLIHINPNDLLKAMSEIVRCSRNYVMGFEYFSDQLTEVNYRGNEGYLWKLDYAGHYQQHFPNLGLLKELRYPYILEAEKPNVDAMFLLKKVNA